MTTIGSTGPFDINSVKRLPTSAVRKATLEEITKAESVWKDQFRKPVGPADNDPSNTYATVKVNGKVVATLYNGGSAEMSNAVGARAMDLPSMGESESAVGPQLAQKRAEELAKLLGGTVEKADTAQTQAQWNKRPARQWTYDTAAMEQAMAARNANLASARTYVQAQLLAQSQAV